MAAGQLDLIIEQDADFKKELTISQAGSPLNISGWTFAGEIRKTKKGVLVGTFSFNIVDGPNGRVDITIDNALTAAYPAGRWYYDVEYVDGSGDKKRLLEGRALISAEVTQV